MPIITISRQYGSGGSAVAARVAALLGWKLFDNAIVDAVAEQMGMAAERVRALDERHPPLIARLANTLALGAPEVLSSEAGEAVLPPDELVRESTRRVMEEAVAREPVVVVGRGAQLVLSQHADAIHVFCYAPRHALARRVAERESISEAEAARMVDQVNRQRALAVRRDYGRVWGAPENYHLCLNTEWLGIEQSAQIVVRSARDKFPANTPAYAPADTPG
jgi:cytidylate kinase